MNGWKKRMAAMAAALVLLATVLTGCAKEPDENTTALLENWENFLAYHEQILGDMLWAYDCVEAFSRDNEWDSLLKAQAASSAALLSLRQRELPECTLTQEQGVALMNDGIEADTVLTEYEALGSTVQTKQDTMTLLTYLLTDDVFLTESVEMIDAWLESGRTYVDLEARYLWLATNYLLLQAEQEPLWEQWQTQFPVLAASAEPWRKDTEEIMRCTDQVLDSMGQELINSAGYVGTSEYTLEIVREAVETGDVSTLAREIHTISGVPGYFPVPAWLPDVLNCYLVTDAQTQEKRLVQAGEELSQIPSACYILCTGIALEEVEAYEERMASVWGLDTYGQWEEAEQTYQVLITSGSSQMMIEWTQEETILFLTEPVGCLIPELYLMAMLAQ